MYNKMCPYCGGMHAPGQCPMFMNPAMPPMMPSYPMPLPKPVEGGMGSDMHDMMMEHTRLLQHIAGRVDQIYQILQSMQTGMAKG